MPSNKILKLTLTFLVFVTLATSLVVGALLVNKEDALTESSAWVSASALHVERDIQLPKKEPTGEGLPVSIEIPEIGVDAPVVAVGLTPQGKMAVTNNPDDVAWYQPGPRPGEIGSAVLAGHYGTWASGEGSVFDDLHTLRKGDKVSVIDDNGVSTTFVVRESKRYEPDADATDVFESDDGKAHLNLITCEGTWNDTAQRYSKRLVVFTDKE
jgi:sortase A